MARSLLLQCSIQLLAQVFGGGRHTEVGQVLPEALIAGGLTTHSATSYSARSRTWTCSPRRWAVRSITDEG